MSYILGASKSKIYNDTTSHRLSELLGIEFRNTLKNVKGGDVLVRYGVSAYPLRDYHFTIVLNNSQSIVNASNKYMSLVIMKEHKVPIPEFYTKQQLTTKCLPVLRRLNYHTRGRDIIKVTRINNVREGDFYTEFIEGEEEYRIHIFKGEIIRVQKKVDTTPNKPRRYIRSFENGYELRDNFENNYTITEACAKIALKAVKSLGLDFGAVDILISNKGKPIVLEVNTAPRLNMFGRQLYTLYIAHVIGKEIDLLQLSRLRLNKHASKLVPVYRDIIKIGRE